MRLLEPAELLIPKEAIDYTKWSVIACDQFTSEIEYWNHVHQLVDNVPSTYHIILPEAYLNLGFETRIQQVNENMDLYLRSGIFQAKKGIVLVDRLTPFHPQRLGLVTLIDLEAYEYQPGKHGQIVASEKTVYERIPPRVTIREKAPIEVPHVLVLFDDTEAILPNLYQHKDQFECLYDFHLNMGGGHIKGYLIQDAKPILDQIIRQSEATPLVVGDGNHSLAAAKVCWENIKKTLPEKELQDHPARYAMVEITSIYDEGLAFEPIHRIIYNADEDFIHDLNRASFGSEPLQVILPDSETYILTPESPFETIRWIQDFLDEYLLENPKAKVDYVHGLSNLKTIVESHPNAIGITLPPLGRNQLFAYIKEHGVLPRKSFSLGEAVEKRYYLESRIIQKGRRFL